MMSPGGRRHIKKVEGLKKKRKWRTGSRKFLGVETQNHAVFPSGCLAEVETKSYRQNSSRSKLEPLWELRPEEGNRKQRQ